MTDLLVSAERAPAACDAATPVALLAQVVHVLDGNADAASAGSELADLVAERDSLYAQVARQAPGWDPRAFDADAWRERIATSEQRVRRILDDALVASKAALVSHRKVRHATQRYQR